MSYVPTKPDPGPSPKLDAPQIKTNFTIWESVFNENHIEMNDFNQGDHVQVIMERQSGGPIITQDLTVLFNKNAPAATTGGVQPQLFVKVPVFLPTDLDTTLSPSQSAMQLTYNTVNTTGPQYQSFLPGGYVLYMGSITSASATITLSPAPTKIVFATATADTLAPPNFQGFTIPWTISTKVLTNNTFSINSSASGVFTIRWLAIAIQ